MAKATAALASPASVVDAIVTRIKDGIGNGDYAPGQRLIEAELTTRFGTSRGPVREAFRRLAAEGLVLVEANRGASVKRLNRDEVGQLFEVRMALEGLAARLAAERIDRRSNRRRLTGLNQRLHDLVAGGNGAAYLEGNIRLHALILDMAGNQLLADLVARLQMQAVRLQVHVLARPGAMARSQRDHERIVDAILAGNGAAAERSMRAHVLHSRQRVMQVGAGVFA